MIFNGLFCTLFSNDWFVTKSLKLGFHNHLDAFDHQIVPSTDTIYFTLFLWGPLRRDNCTLTWILNLCCILIKILIAQTFRTDQALHITWDDEASELTFVVLLRSKSQVWIIECLSLSVISNFSQYYDNVKYWYASLVVVHHTCSMVMIITIVL